VEVAGRKISKYDLALLGFVLIGLFLRVYHLGTESLWIDEAWSISMSKASVLQLFVDVAQGDVHPPLYYFVLHYWVNLFGTSEFGVRLLSSLFGVLAIPMIYVVGRQLLNKEAGLVAALILALSSFNIRYSQETRMYSLIVLFALLSMYFFLRCLQRNTLASSAGYVLSTTFLVYTHYYGFFVVLAQNIYIVTLLLLSRRHTYRLKYWVALQTIMLALFLPWAIFVRLVSLRNAPTSSIPPAITTLFGTFSSYSGTPLLLALFAILSVLSLFVYQKVSGAIDWKEPLKALESYSWQVRIQDATTVYFLAVWLLTVSLIPFILSRFSTTLYGSRYTIAASVALYLLVAKGVVNINHKSAKLAVIGVIIVLSVANLQGFYNSVQMSQAREATQFIDANAKSKDVVLVFPYVHNLLFGYYNNRTDIAVKQIHSPATPSENLAKEVRSDVASYDRVWLFYINNMNAREKATENSTFDILNESYANSYKKHYVAYDVYLYEKRV
jgi:mannosyltransferase